MENRNCSKCEEEYVPHHSNQKNCVTCLEKYHKGFSSSSLIRTCKGCGEDFKRTPANRFYCSSQCQAENKDLLSKYGITRKDWDNMYEAQRGVCAICSEEGIAKRSGEPKLCVDHCHKTGKVRGLLCHMCNRALGLFYDNTHTISKAITYLEGATTIEKSSTPKQVEAQSKGLHS